ncbi:MAG: DNA-directed RNA polymerase subunit N [Candidatus Marsarchaeota archaeon]|nr:DNA-directed RNA polymerase subunit N [Candidatus Marsarchaeota archaeon]
MMMPVRCFTCGAVLADKWEEYEKRTVKEKEDPAKVLDDLGVKRYCCRRMFISNVELIDEFITINKK